MNQNNKNSTNVIKWHLKQIGNLVQSMVILSGGLPQDDSVYGNTMENVLHTLSTLIDLEMDCIKQEIECAQEHIRQ